jgi:signal transduction histidine kinase
VLARSDRGPDAAEPVDLAESAARALDLVAGAAAERGIELRSSLASAQVRGDGALLDRLAMQAADDSTEG